MTPTSIKLTNGEELSYHHNAVYYGNKKMQTKWQNDGDKLIVNLDDAIIGVPYSFIPQSVWKVLNKGLYILEGN